MCRLLQISLIFLASHALEVYSEEACGTEFQRDCDEKDIYLLIDKSYEADRRGDLLAYENLHKEVKIRCKENVSQHLSLLCRGYSLEVQARDSATEEDDRKIMLDLKDYIVAFQKLDYFHTDFLHIFFVLLNNYLIYDENLYDYLKETILLSKPESKDQSSKEYLYALAVWHDYLIVIIQHYEDNEELILDHYKKALDLYSQAKGITSDDYLRTKLNLAYYYQNYYYLDLSYLTKSFQICSDIVLDTTLKDSVDAHLSCWLLLDDLDYEKDSGSTQKGFYYRVFLENYLKALKEYDFFDVYIDQNFLNSFPAYFSQLSCYERPNAWNIYQDLWKVRWERYTGNGVLNNHREDYERLGADISITADALWCAEDGMNESLKEDLIIDLTTLINKTFDVDLETSDVAELFAVSDAIEALSFYISDEEYEVLKKRHYERAIKETEWFEKNFNEYTGAHDNLVIGLERFFQYDGSDSQLILERLSKIKEMFIDSVSEIGLDSDHSVIFDLFTAGLYGNGFKDEAFKNYLDMFSINPLSMESDLDPFLGDAYHANTRLSMNSLMLNEKYSKEVNDDLFRNLKFLDRGPLELSIIKSKLSDGLNKAALENYLISERLKNQFINKYSDGPLNEDFSRRSQEAIVSGIRQFNNLSESEKSDIYASLYPDTSLEKIQSKIKEDETLILLYAFSTGPTFDVPNKEFITSIAINQFEMKIEVKEITKVNNLDFYEFIELIEEEMKQSLFDGNKNYIEKIDLLSEIVIPDFRLKDKVIFISNLDEFISPSLLRKENKWLIEDKEIKVNFSLVDFLTEQEVGFNVPSNYIGIGNVDYSGFEENYDPLPNTSSEIKNSSQEFDNKKILLGKDANETSLKKLDLNNALVHFATHTNKSEDSDDQLPSIVLTKNEMNDGYLDVFEISELNFNDSHIVLAACDTDSSIYEDSDNFSGFVKSFQVAGARSVLATRWEIETASAQKVTESYIEKIKNKRNPQKALAETQRELIDLNYHPFLWSGYFVIE